MTVQPHVAQARAVCLNASIAVRTAAETPDQIVARAEKFEAYVLRDNPAGAAPQEGQAAGKKTGEKQGNPKA
jgi:hypothetical protein